jgi:two-component system LytT family response regulator
MTNKPYQIIIIDDEAPARLVLKTFLQSVAPHLILIAECDTLASGVKAIRKNKPDLIFLDIEMPGHSGLELLDFFNEDEITFDIIFTTGYSEYAIKAFKLSAIDYLLKPIDEDELKEAIQRFEKRKEHGVQNLNQLRQELESPARGRIAVPMSGSVRFIELKEVLYLKADNSYTEIHFENGELLVVSRTLKNFEQPLELEKGYFRCHKSYIVNLNFVKEWVKSDGGHLLLKNGVSIPVSADKTNELTDRINLISR